MVLNAGFGFKNRQNEMREELEIVDFYLLYERLFR